MNPMNAIKKWNGQRLKNARKRKLGSDKPNRLAILAIMKNEALNVREWVEHYIWQGADHIFLIDNGSTDTTVEVVRELSERYPITLNIRTERWRQEQHYHFMVREHPIKRDFEWLIIADLDEYWFCKTGESVSSKLSRMPEFDVVYVNHANFGAGENVLHPESLRKSIVRRQPELNAHVFSKYAVRTSCLSLFPRTKVHRFYGADSSRTITDSETFQLNHYFLQSLEFWREVKCVRGDAVSSTYEEKRQMSQFEEFEKSCTLEDRTLADQLARREG